MRAEIPRQSWRAIGDALGQHPERVRYWLVKREQEERGSQRGPTAAGRSRLSIDRQGAGNPSYKDGARVGERAGKTRFKSGQLRCQAPGCFKRGHHEHHVVYQQEVARRGGDEWDSDNALRLCHSCHSSHHRRGRILPVSILRDENIKFAFTLLGAFAYDYLRRRYIEDDERLERAFNEWERMAA